MCFLYNLYKGLLIYSLIIQKWKKKCDRWMCLQYTSNRWFIHCKQNPNKHLVGCNGYIHFSVRKSGEKDQKKVQAYRFTWECLNGVIPDNKLID